MCFACAYLKKSCTRKDYTILDHKFWDETGNIVIIRKGSNVLWSWSVRFGHLTKCLQQILHGISFQGTWNQDYVTEAVRLIIDWLREREELLKSQNNHKLQLPLSSCLMSELLYLLCLISSACHVAWYFLIHVTLFYSILFYFIMLRYVTLC